MSTTDAYFLVPIGPGLAQLWETDGSATGTRRVANGSFPIDPAMLTTAGDNLFFVDKATGNLWVTDGKVFGTNVLTSGIRADDLTAVGTTLYFVDDSTGLLWTSDGTAGGTLAVTGLSAKDLTAVGNTLFFVDANTGDLWTLSGGTAQDVGNLGAISDLTAVGNNLYFVDSAGDLWNTDGSNLAEVSPAQGGFTSPTTLTAAGGILYFTDSAGNLWTSDATVGGTLELTSGVQAGNLTAVGSELFFVDQVTGALWVTNGRPGGTQELAGSFFADNLTAVGNELYFTDDDAGALWKSDGTVAGTVQVTQTNSVPFDPKNLADVNGALYFQAFDPLNGTQLWTSDGTAVGTHLAANLGSFPGPETNSGEFQPLGATNNETFVLEAVDPTGFSDHIYVTSGIPGSALTPVDPGQNLVFDSFSTAAVGDELFFTPADTANFPNYDLWVTDGTAAGTRQIVPQSGSFAAPSDLTALDGKVYFVDTSDDALWETDGTSQGTVEIGDSFGTLLGGLTVFGNSLAFASGNNIWLINGTNGTQTEISGISAGPSVPFFDLTTVGNTLYFTDGTFLYASDGTQANTAAILVDVDFANLTAVGTSTLYYTVISGLWDYDGAYHHILGNFTDPTSLTPDGSTLYFLATDQNNTPDTLWEANGTTATEVYSSSVGTTNGAPTVANGTLFFIDGATGDLWMTTPGSTTATGVTSNEGGFSLVSSLRTEGGTLYFEAFDPTHGYQLWTSDSTAAGTVRLTDNTEAVGASPSDITAGPGPGTVADLHTTALASGGFAIAFTAQSDTPGDMTDNIYAEVFNASGQQIGGMIEVNRPNAFDDGPSFITALPDGDFAVTWQTGAKADEIDTRVFDASGYAVSSAQVVTPAGHSAEAVQTIALSDGGYAVLYEEEDAGEENVYVGLFNADGIPVFAPVEVDVPAANVSNFLGDISKSFDATEHNQIVATADGFAVTWQQSTSTASNVVVRAFNNDGTPVTGEIIANGADNAVDDSPEEITALGGDSFAVEWGSVDASLDFTVFTRAFDAPNYTASSPVQADIPGPPTATTFDSPNHLVTLSNGNYVALWDQIDELDTNGNTFVQVYNAQGQVVSASPDGIQVDTNPDVFNSSDQVIVLAGGGFAVMWEQIDTTNPIMNIEDVFVRTFDALGNATSAPVMVDIPDGCTEAGQEMIALPDGSFEVLYTQIEDTANGAFQNLLMRLVGAGGTLLSAPTVIASTPANPADTSDVSGIFGLRSSLAGSQLLLTGEIDGDTVDNGPSSPSLAVQFTPPPPVISNPDTVIAVAGTGAIALNVAAPTDSDGSTPTITINTVPTYGTVQYFDGATFVSATAGTMLTPVELASLEYTPPASGEFGGQTISYTATDGTASNQGTIAVTVLVDDTGPSNLYFSAFAGPGNTGNPDLYTLDSSGNPLAIPLNIANGSFAGEDGGFFQFAGDLYFNANGTATSGTEALYALAPNGTVTPVSSDGNSTDGFFDANSGVSANFTEFDGSLYFAADTADNIELVKLNADRTSRVFDIDPGPLHGSMPGQNGGFVEFNGDLYFSAFTSGSELTGNGPDLIQLDPSGNVTVISTRSPANAGFGSDAGEDGGFYVFDNALYFNAFSDTLGDTLFKLTAGSTAPEPVDPTGGILVHLPTTNVTGSGFHEFDGALYFNEFSSALSDDTLFKLGADGILTPLTYFNGTANEALEGAGGSGGFADFAGSTYFVANTQGEGTQLFKLDASGIITEITDVPGGSFDDNLPGNFAAFNDALYFDAYTAVGGDGLFQLTANGTLTQIDLGNGAGATTLAGTDGGFQIVGSNLYFSAFTSHGDELVMLGADGTVQEFDINPGAGNNSFGTGGGSPGNALGAYPNNAIVGTPGNDILVGTTPNETISGGAGNDVLAGRGGNDILTGGNGADVFQFSLAGAANIDTVTDYSLAQGDTLDISALVDAKFAAGSEIVDFVRLIASGNDLILQVDPNGSADNPHAWQNVAILQNANVAAVNQVSAFFAGADHTITQTTDFIAPTVQSVAFSAPTSTVGSGAVVTVTVNMSEAVLIETALGSPTLGLNDGGVATFDAADSTSTALVFDYTVLAGQNTSALATSASGVSLNGGTIEDLSANEADLTGSDNVTAVPTIAVSNIPPTPVVTPVASNINASASETFTPGQLFSVSAPIGSPVLSFEVEDEATGGNNGFWVLDGAVLPNGQLTTLTAAQLSQLTFVAGSASTPLTDTLEVAASDSAGFGPFTSFTVSSGAHASTAAPTVTAANELKAPGLTLAASSLFSGTAFGNNTITSYEVVDNTTDSGHWVFNGVVEPANQLVLVTAAQLAQLTFATGYGTDNLMVRANDGSQWSSFTSFTVTPPPNAAPPAGTKDTLVMLRNADGAYEFYDIGQNKILLDGPLGQINPALQVAGVGGFNGADTADLLMRDPATGAFTLYDVSNNNITGNVPLGQVGPEWTVSGVGDFSTRFGETDMLMRNSNSGAFEVYDIANNTIMSAQPMGQVGLEWQIAGFGDFSTRANETDMLMRNANTGAFEVYDIANNTITSAQPMGQVGLEWQIAGFGDFSTRPGETDMLLRNSNNGAFEVYDIVNNTITSAQPMGQVGLEWTIAGFGNFSGNANETDMLMRNSNTGVFTLFDIGNNTVTGTAPMGQVGLEWSISGVSASVAGAPPSSATAQLTQAMASFAPSVAAPSPLDQTTPVSANAVNLLTAPHA